MRATYPARIVLDVQADCDENNCEVSEKTLTALTKLITGLQDEVETRIDAYNGLVDSISHYKYSIKLHEQAEQELKSQIRMNSMICAGKQIVLMGICGAGLAF